MYRVLKFFQKQYEKYLRISYSIDVKIFPTKLLQSLNPITQKKGFTKLILKKTTNGFKILRRLTITHLLLMNSNDFYQIIQQFVSMPCYSKDEWLNEQCIKPYYHFLKKVTSSYQLYSVTKQFLARQVSFEKFFYLVHLITDLFKIVQKMPLLGRYFKQSNQIVTSSFVQCIAIQAQKIYTVLKCSLQEMITNHRTFITDRQDEKIVKAMLQDSLPYINEEMKKLFLDKYFYPYGKGIGIRLFRVEQQSQSALKIINGIISDHKQTERKIQKQDLQKTLFPQDGKINLQFYEKTLKPIEHNEQIIIKDLDEIEQQQQIVIPVQFNQSTPGQQKILKQTSHQLEIVHDV